MKPLDLALLRKGTRDFVASDPTTLILIPSNKTETHGTVDFSDLPARAAQTFKVIYSAADGGGKATTDEGTETARWDFILVGAHTNMVAIGDHWAEGQQSYTVEWVQPYNEYEVKAGGVSHGDSPAHG